MFSTAKNKSYFKNHTPEKMVGHNSEFIYGIYWWTWKITIYLKKLLRWTNKKWKNLNIYVVFFNNNNNNNNDDDDNNNNNNNNDNKTPRDIIILYLRTKNLDDMIYSSCDIEHDRLKLAILVIFCPFTYLKA